MDIFINPDSSLPLTDQIYEGIREGITHGRVGPGDRLPPTRSLAETLGVSRFTVTTAYGRLSAEGFLEGRRGGGSVVSDLRDLAQADRHRDAILTRAEWPQTTDIEHDLRTGVPDQRLFPNTLWKRYARWAIDQHTAVYGDPGGDAGLRLVLARWIARSRGVEAGSHRVVVTSGAQQAFYLLARSTLQPGDVVAMEDPGYNRFRDLVVGMGASLAPVPVDGEGIIVTAIPEDARLVYVTPSHQYPTGVTMSMPRRLDLLALAQRHGMVVIEDDYDSEFRYVDRPLEPLQRLDTRGLVAYVASFSKVLSPALRLGFAVAPPDLLARMLELRIQVDRAPSQIEQLTLKGFIGDGHLDRHLRKARRIYRARHEQVTRFLDQTAAEGWTGPPSSNAGIHVGAALAEHLDESRLVARLRDRGVAMEGYAHCSALDDAPGGLMVGFGRIRDSDLEPALSTLKSVLSDG